MSLLTDCCDFIIQFEGFSAEPYLPTKNDKPTIGYGNTVYEDGRRVSLDDEEIDEDRAMEILEFWVQKIIDRVQDAVMVDLTHEQTIALVSFDYNTGALRGSTLLRKLNKGDYEGAALEFPKWVHQAGKVLKGLVRRREQERLLFELCE